MDEDKSRQAVYDLLAQDRFMGQDMTDRDRELLELEVRLNHRIDKQLLENPDKIPKAVYFIIPNEFGERFCFYGVKPLLQNYFTYWCGSTPEHSKVLVHAFVMVTYFCPVLGAAVSDSFLGKYRTIVSLSILYFIGVLLLSIFSINGVIGSAGSVPLAGPLAALMLIALGTGGIKPCVSTHGGDQYLPHQKKGIDWFFSIFYTSINVGSLISQNVTPQLKDHVECFGAKCYFASYLLPAVMFGLATAAFIFGERYYRIVPPTGEFLPFKCAKTAFIAARRYLGASSEDRKRKGSWLNFAEDVVGAPFVEETRNFGRVIYMIIPTMFFWMIYDQTSTEWQIQYSHMDDRIGSVRIQPEVFQVINPVLIIMFVPGLGLLYPRLEKWFNFRFTTLRRMGTGFFLVVVSFVISGILNIAVEKQFNPTEVDSKGNPVSCFGCLHAWWQIPQWIVVSLAEALTSPTGLYFCYEESGKALKAQSSSMWLLMVSFGNLIVTAVESSLEESKAVTGSAKYFMYAGIGLVTCIWFVIQAYFYKYRADVEAERELANREVYIDDSKKVEEGSPI
ncbi:uncharacterized protein VTP21DRAFT_11388 [Calcarisporiella thermophila]|uniref:uncharacterized protein n=1 Tax=Calcarisporiella thermophila TaxID=911321 RepID=UPI00374355C4